MKKYPSLSLNNMKKHAPLIVVAIIIALLFFSYRSMFKRHNNILDNCQKTNLFVIGDKQGINRIYDCENAPFVKDKRDD